MGRHRLIGPLRERPEGFENRVRDSYRRLEERGDADVTPKAMKPGKQCGACHNEPAWSEGMCTTCLVARCRKIARARKRAIFTERRRTFFLARRAARLAGDAELVTELLHRQYHAKPLPTDYSDSAEWRQKYRRGPDGT